MWALPLQRAELEQKGHWRAPKYQCSGREVVCHQPDESRVFRLRGRFRDGGIRWNRDNPPGFGLFSSSTTSATSGCAYPGGMSVRQCPAASPTLATTSRICGRRVLSSSQHLWMNSHNDSEIPIASAFVGLLGRTPRRAPSTKSTGIIRRNGSPVRTCGTLRKEADNGS